MTITLVITEPIDVEHPGVLGDPGPVLLTEQTNAAENGAWIFTAPDVPLRRVVPEKR